ncbi:uncharacterized protein LOC113324378 [Papaver somniferum]|uniref:uncharacterized protein LOC113324378 n=1 Tax=Papaver somniferum TaxID=3469 RepID=UPI000E7047CD|nr:uncharacterized protein LOC113324378 [Papaver somniferum]
MRDGKCKRNFPKEFSECTVQGKDAYHVCSERNNGRRIRKSESFEVYNRMVVPYSPWLLQKYDCHINVEICSSVDNVKYLYKYVYKGLDYVSFGVQPEDHDEITRYKNARWVCAQDAMRKIFSFPLYKVYPSVVRLQIHLPNQQSVRYYDYQMLDEILSDERNLRTTLTEFFVTNACDPRAREFLYREFPERYCWDTKSKEWRRRRSTQKSIGRVYTVPSCAGKVWFLRHILNHITGPTSFDDLLFVDGERCRTFKRAGEKLELLENDQSARASLAEATTVKIPSSLRRKISSILNFCNLSGVRELWD